MKSIIIVFLLLMAFFSIEAASTEARKMAAKYDIKTITACLEKFAANCDRYPTTTEGLSALIHCPENISSVRWQGPYFDISQIPLDPWGNEYVYRFSGIYNTNSFDLYSLGEDGITKSDGNDPDDINNWNPYSPVGTFSEHLEGYIGIGLLFSYIIALIISLVVYVVAIFSRTVRDSLAKHPTVLLAMRLILIGYLLLLLIALLFPRIA